MKWLIMTDRGPKACLTAVVLTAAVSVGTAAAEEIEQDLEMAPDGRVAVENLAGSIEFEVWDRAEVQIRGDKSDDVEEIEINQTSAGVSVRVRNRQDVRRVRGTELRLRVPRKASLEAESVSADISVDGSEGSGILLKTVSGDIEVEASPGQLELASVSGEVEFSGSVPRSKVETVSGEITLVGPDGEISLKTVSGDVSLEAGEVGRGRFETVSGELTLELSLADGGRLACDSMSGDIHLRLPGAQQARFSAQSYSGDINSDFGRSAAVSRGPGVTLDHSEGDNGAEIRLESFSGDISIRRK
jgi:DUF4097 and DUF4098 domain-containing protein YvlB